jgi:hypothetical protein
MRYALALLVGAHGVAHLVGFAVAWHLIASAEVPYKTTVLGGLIDVGHGGTRVVGLIWLATALACMVAGSVLWEGAAWAIPFTKAVLLFSLALCLTALPEARVGLLVDVVLLAWLYGLPLISSSLRLS